MDLKTYIQATPGNGVSLSLALKIPPSFLSQMASGTRTVNPKRAIQIERATGELVTRADLVPDWKAIWPEYSPPKSRRGAEERRKAVRRAADRKSAKEGAR